MLKFEQILLNTSTVISTTYFDQRGILHQDYLSFGPKQNCQDTVSKSFDGTFK